LRGDNGSARSSSHTGPREGKERAMSLGEENMKEGKRNGGNVEEKVRKKEIKMEKGGTWIKHMQKGCERNEISMYRAPRKF
jgi:hypothetical protein